MKYIIKQDMTSCIIQVQIPHCRGMSEAVEQRLLAPAWTRARTLQRQVMVMVMIMVIIVMVRVMLSECLAVNTAVTGAFVCAWTCVLGNSSAVIRGHEFGQGRRVGEGEDNV